MSQSNSIQIQTQIKSNLKIVEVSKRIYNVIRSIVDSSTKPSYEWNKPIFLSDNKIKFVKYKVLPNGLEVKVWEITVEPLKIQKEGAELNATTINVYDGLGNKVVEVMIRNEFTVSELFNHYIVRIENSEVTAKSLHELEYYVIKPSSDIQYAKPVSLADFVNKLMFYYYKAMGVVRNADAAEAKQV
jgi:hypothetical protein